MRPAGPGWETEEREGLETPLFIHLSVFMGFSLAPGPVPGSQHADTQEAFPVWGGDRTMGIQEAHWSQAGACQGRLPGGGGRMAVSWEETQA